MSLYALLIAIDEYHPDTKIPRLLGCANDAHAIHDFLKTQFPADQRKVLCLLNQEATYNNIIDHFGDKHLLKAKEGDTVLVHFSGHGARAFSAPEFKAYYPDGLDENLVCYDSRLPGKYDLADKELAVLIERIAVKKADVIVLLDCCHSGSGTRSAADLKIAESRQWEDREDRRTLESYLNGHFKSDLYIPNSKHILLAACEKRQKAFELSNNQGVFTSKILEVLNDKKGAISYSDLFSETRMLMRSISKVQTPQFEPYGYFNIHNHFLKSKESSVQTFLLSHENDQWEIAAGALQGLGTAPDEQSMFAIFEDENKIGNARTISVHLEKCFVEVEGDLDKTKKYQTKLISIPKAPISVALITLIEGERKAGLQIDIEEQAALHKALQKHKPLYFEFTKESPTAVFELNIGKGLQLIRISDQRILYQSPDKDGSSYQTVLDYLEHLCQWERTRGLGKGTRAKGGGVALVLKLLDESGHVLSEESDNEAIVPLPSRDGIPQKVKYKLEAHNTSGMAKQVALLHFSQDYGIYNVYNDEIPNNAKAIIMEKNDKGYAHSFRLKKKKKAMEFFKIIVSNKKINSAVLSLEDLVFDTKRAAVKRKLKGTANLQTWYAVDMNCLLVTSE